MSALVPDKENPNRAGEIVLTCRLERLVSVELGYLIGLSPANKRASLKASLFSMLGDYHGRRDRIWRLRDRLIMDNAGQPLRFARAWSLFWLLCRKQQTAMLRVNPGSYLCRS